MEDVITRLLERLDRKKIEAEVEEELRFHVEMIRREHVRQGASPEAANAAAMKRFGDVERIKNQCAEISRRSRPFIRALKSFLILVFLAGVSASVFSADVHVRHIGQTLIAVAALSRLLLYARGLSPSSFLSKERSTLAVDV